MIFQMNILNVYAMKDSKELQEVITSYDESSNQIKENFLKGNIVLMDYYTGNIKHVVTL